MIAATLCVGLAASMMGFQSEAGRDETAVEQAVKLVNRGEVALAIDRLRKQVEAHPRDAQARIVLGRILDYDGRTDEAVVCCEAGLAQGPEDVPLLLAIGELRKRQAEAGPNVTRRRGSIEVRPSRDEAAEQRYEKERLAEAAAAYERARKVAPEDPRVLHALARLYAHMEKPEAALALWQKLAERDPDDSQLHLGWALAAMAARRLDEAQEHVDRALALEPRSALAHEGRAKILADLGKSDEAAESQKQADFYRGLPGFVHLEFSPENAIRLSTLGEPDTLEKLANDRSEQSSELLAYLCWTHPHDASETRAFEILEQRGDAATPVLKSLLDDARSTCTVRSTARILARRKAKGILDFLLARLPSDQQAFGFDMDIAGSLDDLGDPRAVGPLVEVLEPARPEADEDNTPFVSRTTARARAALALGAFDTTESRSALERGSKNDPVAAYCLAAVYRLSKQASDLSALQKQADTDSGKVARYLIAPYLEQKVGTPGAKGLAKRWVEEFAAERAAQEKAEKKDGSAHVDE
jgi:Flp pilus assembly protein TadD